MRTVDQRHLLIQTNICDQAVIVTKNTCVVRLSVGAEGPVGGSVDHHHPLLSASSVGRGPYIPSWLHLYNDGCFL